MSENKEIKNGGKVTFEGNDDVYVIKVKSKKFPWWIFLLLLPLLLLIKCNRDISVSCFDGQKNPITNQNVNLEYVSHFLWNNGFLVSQNVSREQTTDNQGNTIFKDLPCSVFSYIFYRGENVKVSAKQTDCYSASDTINKFHSVNHIDLIFAERLTSLTIKLTDLKTGSPLPEAELEYIVNGQNQKFNADNNGIINIPEAKNCSSFSLTGRCKDHYDSSVTEIKLAEINSNYNLPLRPIKKIEPIKIQFVNIDSLTLKPIAGVKNQIKIFDAEQGNISLLATSDSKGCFYVSAKPGSRIEITSQKSDYKDKFHVIKSFSTGEKIKMQPIKKETPPTPVKEEKDLKGKTGDLRINLQWYCKADLDLIVKDPCGNLTYYNRKTTSCSQSRGSLDIDANQNATNEPWKASTSPQENIYWTNPTAGKYTIAIVCCPFHPQMNLKSRKIDFTLTIVDKNGRTDKRGSISEKDSLIFTTYDFKK